MKWKTRYIRIKRYSRKAFRWLGIFLLFCSVFIYVLFKSSYVQTYLTQKASKYFSNKTNTEISISEIDFRPFDTFVLKDLLILDHHKDTLLFANDFYFEINEYDFDKLEFELDLLELNDAYVNINHYKNENLNSLGVFLEKISSSEGSDKQITPMIYIEDIAFENLKIRNWDENTTVHPNQIDFNHLLVTDLNIDADDFIFKEDLIRINTEQFEFKERSGFELLGMSGQLMMDEKSMLLKYFEFETDETDINGDITLEYESFNAFSNFLEEVHLDTYFEETKISSKDIAYFTDAVDGLNRSVTFQGDINGTVSTLKAKNLKFHYGELTYFEGEIEFDNLGTSSDPTIDAVITKLITFEKDIKDIPLYPFTSGNRIKTPLWMNNVGKMEFSGDFVGPTSNFEATGILRTSAGEIKSDVFFKKDTLKDETRIVGKVITNEFNLGQTIGDPDFGLLSMNGELDALAQFENNRLIFSGQIPRIDFKNYSYSNIQMDGTVRDQIFNGKLSVKDTNLVFDFDGSVDFSTSNKQKYDFEAELKKVNIAKVNWSDRDSSTSLSGKLTVDIEGNTYEDLDGSLKLKELTWTEKGKVHKIDSINLTAIKREEREMITVKSDLMLAKIEGKYNLAEIFPTMINIFSKEIPSLVNEIDQKNHKGGNNFSVMFKLHDYAMVNELFSPELNLAKKTRLSGRFNDEKKSFVLHFASDSVYYDGRTIKGIKLYSNNRKGALNIKGRSKYVQLINNLGIENIKFTSSIVGNIVDYKIGYQNNLTYNTFGDIGGVLNLNNLDTIKLGVNQSNLVYRNEAWKIDTNAFASISNNLISVKDFNFFAEDQFFKINGTASSNNTDSLVFNMENFQLDGLQYFWDYINLDVSGRATGEFKLNSAFSDQLFASNLQVDKMILNTQEFGLVKLHTDFLKSSGTINVLFGIENKSGTYENLKVEGNYFPFENGRLAMKASFKNTQLKFMEKYFEGVFSHFKGGKTTGEIDITGTINHPLMDGSLTIRNLGFSVDYLNTNYTIDGQPLLFNKDIISFDDFEISNNLHPKSKARINGYVDLDGFDNISYRMDSVFLEEFICLNTGINENSTYYGNAYVNGLLQLRGDANSNYIGGSVETTKTVRLDDSQKKPKLVPVVSQITLPLDQAGDLEISEFVSFVNLSDTSSKKKLIEEDFDLSGLDLDFNFKINPETKVKIIFDPAVGDEINANGNGAIGMNINTNGKFNMYGDYTVTSGDYYFTLQNIIGKRFVVEPGSKISWDGDPLDAQMAMKTYYRSRANLISLADSTQEADYASLAQKIDQRIEVHSNLGLFGSLWNPDLIIGISLPNGTLDEKDFLATRIFGEDEINRQAFSLILTNQFIPPNSSGVRNTVSGKTGIENGMQFIEGQINNALSGLFSKNLDLGVDYNNVEETGDAENLTKDELRLLAGFKYKNLSLKTDYDINNQVGDIEAEFKITEALKAKAYHKTTNDPTNINNQTTTTYGIGAAYQKSFNSLRELFGRKEEEEKN